MKNERYIRQTSLSGFGIEAQGKLSNAKVLVIGAGGLGVQVLQYLNAMGVGTLGLMDQDTVSKSNLHRQILYSERDIGKSKVEVALGKLKSQNSNTKLIGHDIFLTKENALEIIKDFGLVIDATDNFPTRYLVNDACVILDKPFIHGAVQGFEGRVSVFNYQDGPTYRCLYPIMPKSNQIPNCNEQGVLGVLPGIIGNLQALEAVKVITGVGEVLSGKLLVFDSLDQAYHKFAIQVKTENKQIFQLRQSYELSCSVEVESISGETFEKILNEEKTQLIDVRTPAEYADFHLEIAKNIPLDDLQQNQECLDFDLPIYLLCQSGNRSLKAIEFLIENHPLATFINVEGGMNQLKQFAGGN